MAHITDPPVPTGTYAAPAGVPLAAQLPGGAATWYAPPGPRGTVVTTDQKMVAYPFFVPAARSINYLVVNVTSGGGVGSVCRMGIYTDSNGVPGTLVRDCGTVATTATGNQQITLGSPVALAAGSYWLAAVTQGAPTPNPTLTTFTSPSGWVSWNSAVAALGGGIGYSQTAVAGALPASWSAFNVETAPIAIAVASA